MIYGLREGANEIERLMALLRRIDRVTIWDGIGGEASGLQEEVEAVLGIVDTPPERNAAQPDAPSRGE